MIRLVCSYTVKMNTPVAVFFFISMCLSALHSQAQQTNITVYPAQVLEVAEGVCPSNERREAVRRNISHDVQQIITRQLHNLSSCNQLDPRAASDYYRITNSSGNAVNVYCDTNGRRWNRSGGWFRIAYLNMTDQNQSCPSQWRYITILQGRVTGFGCDSVTYSSLGIPYSQVCGRLVGYQFGSTEAFWYYITTVVAPLLMIHTSMVELASLMAIQESISGHWLLVILKIKFQLTTAAATMAIKLF